MYEDISSEEDQFNQHQQQMRRGRSVMVTPLPDLEDCYEPVTSCSDDNAPQPFIPLPPMSSSSSEEEDAATLPQAGAALGVIRVDSSPDEDNLPITSMINTTTPPPPHKKSTNQKSRHLRRHRRRRIYSIPDTSDSSADYSEDLNKSDDEFLRKKGVSVALNSTPLFRLCV